MDQSASIRPAAVVQWDDGRSERLLDDVAREEPLEICVVGPGSDAAAAPRDDPAGQPLALVMRTPGHDVELAAGFLFSEGVVENSGDFTRLESSPDFPNRVDVELVRGVLDDTRFVRHFSASSACGVCGRSSIEAVRARRPTGAIDRDFHISPAQLSELPARLREVQRVFARTGGLHAAALFDETGRLVVVREDIGRHNAVDKIVGWALLSGRLPLARYGLLVSGRGGFEIVQKAVTSGIPLVACISAPSSLAVQLAREAGQTLVGFLRAKRFVVYAGEDRVVLVSGQEPGLVLASDP